MLAVTFDMDGLMFNTEDVYTLAGTELLARRQVETEGILAAEKQGGGAEAQHTQYAAGFLDKLRAFFEL